jgi:hypothetical protein
MKIFPSCILFILILCFSSVIPRQEKQGRFEIVSMHGSTYAIETAYLLPDVREAMDTISVVLIREGKAVSVDRYVFVGRKEITSK